MFVSINLHKGVPSIRNAFTNCFNKPNLTRRKRNNSLFSGNNSIIFVAHFGKKSAKVTETTTINSQCLRKLFQ